MASHSACARTQSMRCYLTKFLKEHRKVARLEAAMAQQQKAFQRPAANVTNRAAAARSCRVQPPKCKDCFVRQEMDSDWFFGNKASHDLQRSVLEICSVPRIDSIGSEFLGITRTTHSGSENPLPPSGANCHCLRAR